MTERHYWDTCAWLDLLAETKVPAASRPMHTMWGMVERGGLEVLFSPITLTECLFRAEGEDRPYTDPHPSDELFNATGVVLVQVDREIGELSRSLRRLHNVKAPDALHLACAIRHNVDHFVTRDKLKVPTLYRKDGRRLTISTPADVLMGPLGAGRAS